jgi:hypothetical protein
MVTEAMQNQREFCPTSVRGKSRVKTAIDPLSLCICNVKFKMVRNGIWEPEEQRGTSISIIVLY